jgi:hypothetical protein
MGKVVIRAIRAAEAYLDTGAVVTLEIFPPSHPAVADLRRRTTTTQMCKFRLDPGIRSTTGLRSFSFSLFLGNLLRVPWTGALASETRRASAIVSSLQRNPFTIGHQPIDGRFVKSDAFMLAFRAQHEVRKLWYDPDWRAGRRPSPREGQRPPRMVAQSSQMNSFLARLSGLRALKARVARRGQERSSYES